jgi:hypothetical protein
MGERKTIFNQTSRGVSFNIEAKSNSSRHSEKYVIVENVSDSVAPAIAISAIPVVGLIYAVAANHKETREYVVYKRIIIPSGHRVVRASINFAERNSWYNEESYETNTSFDEQTVTFRIVLHVQKRRIGKMQLTLDAVVDFEKVEYEFSLEGPGFYVHK